MKNFDEALGIAELERCLGVSRKAVARALESGEIPNYDICGTKKVLPEDLEAYIDGRYSSKDGKDVQKLMDDASEILNDGGMSYEWTIPGDVVRATLEHAFSEIEDEYFDGFADKVGSMVCERVKADDKELERLRRRVEDEKARTAKAEEASESYKRTISDLSKLKAELQRSVAELQGKAKALEYELASRPDVQTTVVQDDELLEEVMAKDEEIKRLKGELEVANGRLSSMDFEAGKGLFSTSEKEFFADEHKALLLTLARERLETMPADDERRRQRILLKDIVDNNPLPEGLVSFRKAIDDLNPGDEKGFEKGLLALGFEEKCINCHRKFVFRGDDRFTMTLALTSSDRRSNRAAKTNLKRILSF